MALRRSPRRGIDQYRRYLAFRYRTLRCAFDAFVAAGGRTIVELGTTRSFVNGGRRGCMSTDPKYWQPRSPRKWDWGAGMFTRMCACELHERRPSIHSVDTSADAIGISRIATSDWPGLVTFHHMTSEEFLLAFDGAIDLLYMDTGETGAESAELHAREAAVALSRGLVAPRGVVLIDDVHVPGNTASKGARSIPLFREHGFEVLAEGYQVVLQRPATSPPRSGPGAAPDCD